MSDIKLLLVDDEESFVRTLSERLQLRDLASHTVFDGEQALGFIEDKEPDVMILDLRMPGIDGLEVLRLVRAKYPLMQVIIQTGHGNDMDEAEARRLGVFDYLKKPVDIELLVDRIREAHRQKLTNVMSATAFAEAGEHDSAREILATRRG
ncbi:MAG: response regulator [Thermodesulfobacteriota bacterium]